MATNPIIFAADYNAIQTKVQQVLGTYYGQTVNSQAIPTPVTTLNATKITALQWQKLYTDLLICYNHQNASNGSLTYPVSTNTIYYIDYQAYDTMGTSILTNYLQFNSGYKSSQSFTSKTQAAGWGLKTVSTTVRHQISLTFPSAAAAGYFFNSGGTVYFSADMSGGQTATPLTKDFSWASMLSHMGTIAFSGGSCTTLAGAVTPGTGYMGFNSLNSTNQLVYQKLTEASTYSPNQYDIYANITGAIVTFYVEFEDRSGSATLFTIDEPVGGLLTSNSSMSYASGGPTGFTIDVSAYLPTLSTNVFTTQEPFSP